MTGRLLRDAGSSTWNMALDESLLSGCIRDSEVGAPVLRFYSWRQPAITLGRFQDAAIAVNLALCSELGVDVVRRPTGGRAVYHDTDLTYSLIVPDRLVGGLSVRESYRLVSLAVCRAIARSGVELREGTPGGPGSGASADCFAHAAVADLTFEGRKVIGSAQVRRAGWILQQGSLRVWPLAVPTGLFPIIEVPPETPPILPAIHRQELISSLTEEWAALLGVDWRDDRLNTREQQGVSDLVARKYGTSLWNREGKEPGDVVPVSGLPVSRRDPVRAGFI